MNFRNNRSWIILLGSGIGLLIGVVFSAIWANAPARWKQLSFPAISANADRATQLLGLDRLNGILYVHSQSQKEYGCEVSGVYGNRQSSKCQELPTSTDKIEQQPPCRFDVFPTPPAPGIVISQLEVYPCIVDGSMQINYILLDDSSIWSIEQSESELGEGVNNCFALLLPVTGLLFGLAIGVVVAKFA